eukprot:2624632-Prymnesium_polylepis.1
MLACMGVCAAVQAIAARDGRPLAVAVDAHRLNESHLLLPRPLSAFLDVLAQPIDPAFAALLVGPPAHALRHPLGPILWAVLSYQGSQPLVLLLGPLTPLDGRVEGVAPPLQALLVSLARHLCGDGNPIACAANFSDRLDEERVLVGGPLDPRPRAHRGFRLLLAVLGVLVVTKARHRCATAEATQCHLRGDGLPIVAM